MSIAIIGGMDRLKNVYKRKTRDLGYKVKIFGRKVPNLGKRISKVDGIVILTGMVVHQMVAEVNRAARLRRIPVLRTPTSSAAGLKKFFRDSNRKWIHDRREIKVGENQLAGKLFLI